MCSVKLLQDAIPASCTYATLSHDTNVFGKMCACACALTVHVHFVETHMLCAEITKKGASAPRNAQNPIAIATWMSSLQCRVPFQYGQNAYGTREAHRS